MTVSDQQAAARRTGLLVAILAADLFVIAVIIRIWTSPGGSAGTTRHLMLAPLAVLVASSLVIAFALGGGMRRDRGVVGGTGGSRASSSASSSSSSSSPPPASPPPSRDQGGNERDGSSRARRSAKRAPSVAIAAEELGLEYADKAPGMLARGLPRLREGGRTRHLVRGSIDETLRVTAFENMYMVHTGQTSVPVTHAAFLFGPEDPSAAGPAAWSRIEIRPRNTLSRIVRRFTRARGMRLESEAFNRTFHIEADDETFALAFLTPEMQMLLLEDPKVHWVVEPGRFVGVRPGNLTSERLRTMLDLGAGVWRTLVPELR